MAFIEKLSSVSLQRKNGLTNLARRYAVAEICSSLASSALIDANFLTSVFLRREVVNHVGPTVHDLASLFQRSA